MKRDDWMEELIGPAFFTAFVMLGWKAWNLSRRNVRLVRALERIAGDGES